MDAISAFTSQARKLKVKWTEQMNRDVLECKKKAQELISSENPPCNENGRKRGYIDFMKELWDDMGYKNLQLKIQNLRDQAMGDWPDVSDDVPECLPTYATVNLPGSVNWGRNSDGGMITITTAVIDDAYNEVTTWRKNTFLVPYGKTGRDFIDQLTKLIDDWNNRSPMQHLALKTAIVLLATAPQKPGQRSKAKEHQECLEKRLTLWRNGEIESLLRKGRMIQRRLLKSNKNDPPNKARIFAKRSWRARLIRPYDISVRMIVEEYYR